MRNPVPSLRRPPSPGFRRGNGEGGFTLVELMITMVLLGMGTVWITSLFLQSYNMWKRNFEELLLQRNARVCMARMVQPLREARAGTIVISKAANGPNFSQISFTDGRMHDWIMRQNGSKVEFVMPLANGGTTTEVIVSVNVQTLYFSFPNFSTMSLVDVGLTMRKFPYQQANKPIVMELVERVKVRNN
jgi:prepilin-type N-terminal cleavage/methylation domain-containing protein